MGPQDICKVLRGWGCLHMTKGAAGELAETLEVRLILS